jgi:hypothetical protein
MRNAYKILVGKREGKRPEDLGVDERVILKWILAKWVWRVWIGFIWLRVRIGGVLL